MKRELGPEMLIPAADNAPVFEKGYRDTSHIIGKFEFVVGIALRSDFLDLGPGRLWHP